MLLIGISGKRRSGKSTLAGILETRYGVVPVSLAAPLKQLVRQSFNMTADQTDGDLKEAVDTRYGLTPRDIMIRTGSFFRGIQQDFWINKLYDSVQSTAALHTHTGRMAPAFAISDLRFKNEADWLRRHNGILIRLERDEVYTGKNINDPSETELDAYTFDYVVSANGNETLKDLEWHAKRIHDFYLSGEYLKRA